MMYICLDCGTLFEYPQKITEKNGYDVPPYPKIKVCPNCGGTYVKTALCDICGSYIDGEYIKAENGWTICSKCYSKKSIEDGDVE